MASLADLLASNFVRRERLVNRELTPLEKATFTRLANYLYVNIPQYKLSDEYQRGEGEYAFRTLHDYGYFSEGGVENLIEAVHIFDALKDLSEIGVDELPQALADTRGMYTMLENYAQRI